MAHKNEAKMETVSLLQPFCQGNHVGFPWQGALFPGPVNLSYCMSEIFTGHGNSFLLHRLRHHRMLSQQITTMFPPQPTYQQTGCGGLSCSSGPNNRQKASGSLGGWEARGFIQMSSEYPSIALTHVHGRSDL